MNLRRSLELRKYRRPRPTALSGTTPRNFLWFPVGKLAAGLLAAGLVYMAPLREADDWVNAGLLRLLSTREVATAAVVIRVEPNVESIRTCTQRLEVLAAEQRLSSVLLLPPADQLCPLETEPHLPSGSVTRGSLRRQSPWGIVGWHHKASANGSLAQALGGSLPPMALMPDPRGTPVVALSKDAIGRLGATDLSGRVGVVEIAARSTLEATEVASLASAIVQGNGKRPAPPLIGALLGVLLVSLLRMVQRRMNPPWWVSIVASWLLLFGVASGALILDSSSLLPVFHLSIIPPVTLALLLLPQLRDDRRALLEASESVERAAVLGGDALYSLGERDLWTRIGDLAQQAHPADAVLVAELPPRKWHLRFWTYRGMGENVMKERRRDVRRRPYANDQGMPDFNVTRNLLVMEHTPVVVVPLVALGEVEGYVFLCGDAAEQAYLRSPQLAENLSRDLGRLLRRRRSALDGAVRRRPADRDDNGRGFSATKMLDGARSAFEDLRVFHALVRRTPVGLLYADAFGYVRVLGGPMADWLQGLGIALPPGAADAPISAGSLTLGNIVDKLSLPDGQAGSLSLISAATEGTSYRVRVGGNESQRSRWGSLSLRPIREEADGVSWVSGYVGTLIENVSSGVPADDTSVKARRPLHIGEDGRSDLLYVEPVAKEVQRAVRSARTMSGRTIQYEPPRELGYAVANHRELKDTLASFLGEAAERSAGAGKLIVTMEELPESVAVHLLDISYGVPTSVLRRVLLAPSDPPPGLEKFGRLIEAVRASHGRVEISEDDWSIRVTVHLLRARPVVVTRSLPPAPKVRGFAHSA